MPCESVKQERVRDALAFFEEVAIRDHLARVSLSPQKCVEAAEMKIGSSINREGGGITLAPSIFSWAFTFDASPTGSVLDLDEFKPFGP